MSAEPSTDKQVLADRCSRLIRFLTDLARSQSKQVLDVNEYPLRLWIGQLPEHLTLDVEAGPGDLLLSVPAVAAEPPPDLPALLKGWVSLADRDDSSLDAPMLRPTGPRQVEEVDDDGITHTRTETVAIDDAPEILSGYDAWLPGWRTWAQHDRRSAAQRRVYDELYTAQQRLAQEGDTLEFILGTGFLTYRTPENANIYHHLLTTALRVGLNKDTGSMDVRVADEVLTRLEDGALLQSSRDFHAERTNALHERLRSAPVQPLAEPDKQLLREWPEKALGAAESYSDELRAQRTAESRPRIAWAPALLLRPRGRSALLAYYEQMQLALANDGTPPLGLAQLVETLEPSERLKWLEEQGGTSGQALGSDPLFPLPANPEQAQIMDRLRGDNGVVVEGPPGTGKTHTIANLISALLAQGQRVLVTSQKPQALRVLREKLPPDLQRLCVALTDVDRAGSPELAGSVTTLAAEKASHNPQALQAKIDQAADRRTQALSRRSTLIEQIRALRESETFQHAEVAPGFTGTLASIATRVQAQAPANQWMPLPVRTQLPVTPAAAHELLDLLRSSTTQRQGRRNQSLPPSLDGLLVTSELTAMVAAERDAAAVADREAGPLSGKLEQLTTRQHELFETLFDRLDAAAAALRDAQAASPASWIEHALADGFARRDEALWDALATSTTQAEQLTELVRGLGLTEVTLPPLSASGESSAVALRQAAADLRTHLSSGGKLRKMFPPDVQKRAESLVTGAAVDGVAPTQPDQLRLVENALAARVLCDALDRQWALVGVAADSALPLQVRAARYSTQYRLLQHVTELTGTVRKLQAALEDAKIRDVALRSSTDCEAFGSALAAVRLREAARRATQALAQQTAQLQIQAKQPGAAPELETMASAVQQRDISEYDSALSTLAGAHAEQAAQRRCDELYGQLFQAHPELAKELAQSATERVWDERLRTLDSAWAWGQARTFFDEQREPGREQRLEAELAVAEDAVSQSTADLATHQAWQHCLGRMNATQVAALQSYRAAIDAKGKGTGKYAEKYSRAARDAMRDAQGAVPAWIMSLPDVLATIPPIRDSFDVVIVDEASQASLESLFLLWLAPRVIVVGDDKQCTPPEVALGSLEPIFDRLDDLLPDLPSYMRVAFTPRSSLFSILRSRFGQVVRLREHFRCMPEIIEWSSNLFYRDQPLVPLRQFGADRLEPLNTVYVPGAYNEGKTATLRNQLEAEALVDKLVECSQDPAYDGKTFGVVVLQGSAQVDLIRTALMRRLPRKEQEKRRLRIGTPPEFQGDERHVMFLSLVLAPDTRTTSLTKLEYQRRFNVAASRAQDQLWLFHSVTLDALNPSDLRHSYLSYLQARPSGAVDNGLGDVRRDVLRPPFDSLFEQRVFLDIRARGYQVTPQVEVNGRRLDLVVTGGSAKLAVECDGDFWHSSPDQVDADLARERELKRAGWQFWRVRESEYNFDAEAALTSLWHELEARGIRPFDLPAGDTDPENQAAFVRQWSPIALSIEEGLDDELAFVD